MALRRLLITGVSGFVGTHLARTAAARGFAIHGTGLGDPPAVPLASWHPADLTDPGAVASAIAAAAPDAIVHLAAQSSAARSFEAPDETFRANVLGTWNLMEAVRDVAPAARVLAVGTSEVYGSQPVGSRVDEDAAIRPVSPYALSKAAAEALAQLVHERWGLDIVRTRSFGHSGPGQTPRFVIPALAQQIAAIEAGTQPPVLAVGNLDVVRDLTDVRDVVDAYLALLERGSAGAVYNVCRGEGTRLSDAAQHLVSLARVPVRIEVDPRRFRPADIAYLVGDPARIVAATGWRPERSIERTLADVLAEQRGILQR